MYFLGPDSFDDSVDGLSQSVDDNGEDQEASEKVVKRLNDEHQLFIPKLDYEPRESYDNVPELALETSLEDEDEQLPESGKKNGPDTIGEVTEEGSGKSILPDAPEDLSEKVVKKLSDKHFLYVPKDGAGSDGSPETSDEWEINDEVQIDEIHVDDKEFKDPKDKTEDEQEDEIEEVVDINEEDIKDAEGTDGDLDPEDKAEDEQEDEVEEVVDINEEDIKDADGTEGDLDPEDSSDSGNLGEPEDTTPQEDSGEHLFESENGDGIDGKDDDGEHNFESENGDGKDGKDDGDHEFESENGDGKEKPKPQDGGADDDDYPDEDDGAAGDAAGDSPDEEPGPETDQGSLGEPGDGDDTDTPPEDLIQG